MNFRAGSPRTYPWEEGSRRADDWVLDRKAGVGIGVAADDAPTRME